MDKMDAESLSFLPKDDDDKKKSKEQTKLAPLPPKQYMIFFMGTTAILFLTCLFVLFQPNPLVMKQTLNEEAFEEDFSSSAFSALEKWTPFPKEHDGWVSYSSHATQKEGIVYKREFTVPCDDGVLVFNIGPAPEDQKYEFEIYDDAYLWSNNDRLCFLYPRYKAYQVWTQPFWTTDDPSVQKIHNVNIKKTTRISHKVNKHSGAKKIDSAIEAKGGDYVVMAHGKFWSPHYWDGLRSNVHSWTKDTDIDFEIEKWVASLE